MDTVYHREPPAHVDCHSLHTAEFNNAYYYDGELGALYTPEATTFRLWAPTACAVDLVDFGRGESLPMLPTDNGTWTLVLDGDRWGTEYRYRLRFADGPATEINDPYARATTGNATHCVVLDPDHIAPEGWSSQRMEPFRSMSDAIIYEAHVRDLTIGTDNGIEHKGKFLGLTEAGTRTQQGAPSGLDYLTSLGVTHVQFLPIYDFETIDELGDLGYGAQYNWGYDPANYNVPEGSYSTNPRDPQARIVELKAMIQALHDKGIRVIMDVVYNHVYDTRTSPLAQSVPGYFFRKDAGCNFHNGTGVGNETASEQPMMRKYIVDSITYWARTFNIDGFRFDLMGIHDVDTMRAVRSALDKIDPSIIILGEGWDMGNHPAGVRSASHHNARDLPRIGFFNDSFRDIVKGDNFKAESAGFVSGNTDRHLSIDLWNNLIGGQHVRNFDNPGQSVVYNEAHDNFTMYDKLKATLPQAPEKEIVRRHLLATSVQYLANGMLFLHAGQEFLRSKGGDYNSYKSPDPVNEFFYDRAIDPRYAPAVDYVRQLNHWRTNTEWVRIQDYRTINDHYRAGHGESGALSYTIIGAYGLGTHAHVYINARTEPWHARLPAGAYEVEISDCTVHHDRVRLISEGTVEVAPLSAMVLRTADTPTS